MIQLISLFWHLVPYIIVSYFTGFISGQIECVIGIITTILGKREMS